MAGRDFSGEFCGRECAVIRRILPVLKGLYIKCLRKGCSGITFSGFFHTFVLFIGKFTFA